MATGRRLSWAEAGAGVTVTRADPVRRGARLAEGQTRAISHWEDLALFLPPALLGSVLGIYAVSALYLYHIDSVARTFSAAMVLLAPEAKLANIGFIWAPVPALARLPLVALWPDLAYNGGAGAVSSSVAAGVCLVLINRILAPFVPARSVRWTLVGLYQLNPLVLYLTFSGLSEIVFLAFILLAWLAFQRVVLEEPLPFVQVAVMGAACAGAVLSRYESLAYVLALGACFVVILYFVKRPGLWPVAEGLSVAFVMPWAYALGLWMFFNAMIMGDPIYFLSGKASLAEFQESFLLEHAFLLDFEGNPVAAFLFMVRAAWDVSPLYVVLTPALGVVAFIRRDLLLEALLLTGATFPFFQWFISLEGQSSGFLRYYFYVALFATLQLGYALQPRQMPFLRRVRPYWVALTVGVLMAAGNYATWVGLEDPGVVVVGEANYLRALVKGNFEGPGAWGERRRDKPDMSHYLRDVVFTEHPDAKVLIDEQRANDIILFTGRLDRFVTTSSSKFTDYLRNPVGNVTHMMVPEVVTSGTDLLLETYPLLYEQGTEFATLEHELGTDRTGHWRLYKVKEAEPTADQSRR